MVLASLLIYSIDNLDVRSKMGREKFQVISRDIIFLSACLQVGRMDAGGCQSTLAGSNRTSVIGRVIFADVEACRISSSLCCCSLTSFSGIWRDSRILWNSC